jgi:hypothetical protein
MSRASEQSATSARFFLKPGKKRRSNFPPLNQSFDTPHDSVISTGVAHNIMPGMRVKDD